MKFSAAAVLAAAAGASAWSNVTYTTEVVTAYTTYCPAATEITHNGQTYTVTSATTLTITNCPCTITKPVTISSSAAVNSTKPATTGPATGPATTGVATTPVTVISTPIGTISGSASATKSAPTGIATAGAGKAAALSGGALAGVLGLAAFIL